MNDVILSTLTSTKHRLSLNSDALASCFINVHCRFGSIDSSKQIKIKLILKRRVRTEQNHHNSAKEEEEEPS